MGLKETIQAGALSAFAALGNLKIEGVFHSVNKSYNATTGAVSETTTSTPVSMIRSDFSKGELSKEYNPDIRKGDFKFMVLGGDVIDPNLVDHIVSGGITYSIIGIEIDPADAVYEFHVRAKV